MNVLPLWLVDSPSSAPPPLSSAPSLPSPALHQVRRRPRRVRVPLNSRSRQVHHRVDTSRRAREAALLDRLDFLLHSPLLSVRPDAVATAVIEESRFDTRLSLAVAPQRKRRSAKCDILEACVREIECLRQHRLHTTRGQLPSIPSCSWNYYSASTCVSSSSFTSPTFAPLNPPLSPLFLDPVTRGQRHATMQSEALMSNHTSMPLISAFPGCVRSISE